MKRRLNFSRRTWSFIGVGAGILALALVIVVSSALSAPKKTQSPEMKALAQQMESTSLTDQGLSALSASETATAEALLKRAVALNPNNTRAVVALTRIRQSTTGSSSRTPSSPSGSKAPAGNSTGSSGAVTTKPKAGPFDKQVDIGKLVKLTPKGYEMYPAQVTATEGQVSGDPTTPGVHVLWAVHDRGSTSEAPKFITNVSKRAYAKNGTTASIDGASAYLGTDGVRYATAAYVRGRYVFEVIVSIGNTSMDLKQAIAMARDAAAAFPDAP